MSSSQFIFYSSSDPGNGSDQPGVMYGTGGDLIRVLDKCLVSGYTGKAAAGWTKPIANSGTGVTGCYKQGAGALQTVFVNDNAPNGSAIFRDAWATGWESLTAVTAPVGVGTGQFPTPAQLLTTGHVVWRKSATSDSTTGRAWQVVADSTTVYMFTASGDAAGTYNMFGFGDIYSLKGATDAYRCFIAGGHTENAAGAGSQGHLDSTTSCTPTAANVPGKYMPRTYGGFGTSIQFCEVGDLSKVINSANLTTGTPLIGTLQTPNGTDNSYYLCPLTVCEISGAIVRGRLRGLYHVCHPLASFVDGQTFQGSNDFSGKSFVIMKQGANLGFLAVETSSTVETN